jgi:hypothetical protein
VIGARFDQERAVPGARLDLHLDAIEAKEPEPVVISAWMHDLKLGDFHLGIAKGKLRQHFIKVPTEHDWLLLGDPTHLAT